MNREFAVMAASNTASNIGNAFFYQGVKYALELVFPGLVVAESVFSPVNAYRLNARQSANAFDYFAEIESARFLVIAGPVLDKDFGETFAPALKRAQAAGVKVFVVSAGGRAYDDAEVSHCRSVLKRYPPHVFISRDADTYQNYGDLALHAYNGICFAFFAPNYFAGYDTPALGRYVVSTFDFAAEPDLSMVTPASLVNPELLELSGMSPHQTKDRFRNFRYLLQRNLPADVNGVSIIRTCHRPLRSKRYIFFKRNIISSFSPYPYLNIYRNASLTITDRLHAAVTTLAYGNSARLVLHSNRTRLLERAGCQEVTKRVFKADGGALAEEKRQLINWLSRTVGAEYIKSSQGSEQVSASCAS